MGAIQTFSGPGESNAGVLSLLMGRCFSQANLRRLEFRKRKEEELIQSFLVYENVLPGSDLDWELE